MKILPGAEVGSKKFLPDVHFFVFVILAICILNAEAILSKGCISLCYFFIYQNLVSNWDGKEGIYLFGVFLLFCVLKCPRPRVNYSNFLHVWLILGIFKTNEKFKHLLYKTQQISGMVAPWLFPGCLQVGTAGAFCHPCLSSHGKVCRCFSMSRFLSVDSPVSTLFSRGFFFSLNRVEAAADACC